MFKDIKEKNIFIMTERREIGSNKERPNENSGTEKNNI